MRELAEMWAAVLCPYYEGRAGGEAFSNGQPFVGEQHLRLRPGSDARTSSAGLKSRCEN